MPRSLADREHGSLSSIREALAEADIVDRLVDHRELRELAPESPSERIAIDTRGTRR